MSFGPRMRIEFDKLGVELVPLTKDDTKVILPWFQKLKNFMYTGMLFASTLEDEVEWFDRARKSETQVTWGIKPDGSNEIVGITSIHYIRSFGGNCSTGIVIGNTHWQGRGVGTRAHYMRTLFVSDYLNRLTITTQVRMPNVASRKALEKMGYMVTGVQPRDVYRDGEFLDTNILSWFNPYRIDVLYPEGLPTEYEEGVNRAKTALDFARQNVVML